VTKQKTIWIAGDGIVLPEGNASTNRLIQIAYGFKNSGCFVKLIPMQKPKNKSVSIRGLFRCIKYEFFENVFNEKKSILRRVLFPKSSATIDAKDICSAIDENVDLIFCGSSSRYSIILLKILAKKLNACLVYDIVEYPTGSWLTKEIDIRSFPQIARHLINLFYMPITLFSTWRIPDHLTCITHELKNKLKQLGYSEKNLNVLPIVQSKSSLKTTSDTQLKKNIGNVLIHSGSTSFPKDGIMTILKGFLLARNMGINVLLEFYGPIGKAEKHRILDYCKKNKIIDFVSVVGYVDIEELYQIQRKALANVCYKPNNIQNRYNFATKIIDYLDSGRPTILSKLPAYGPFFKDKVNAIITEEYSPKSFAKAVEYLVNNPKQAEEIGFNGRKILIDEFCADNHCRNLLKKFCLH
jgi:glycosyltransferase involved in cell wall biosynthesis